MPEVHTTNSILNIFSYSTLVALETKDVIPVTNIEVIKNIESNSVGVKSSSGSCNIQVENETEYKFYILVDEGSFRFFNDFSKVSCDLY
jgi:hypothetical protein